jgi:hypothetical protein
MDQTQEHQPLLEALHELIQVGSLPETISHALGLKLEIAQQIIAATQTSKSKHEVPEDILPTCIYSYRTNSHWLGRTDLVTGELSHYHVPSYLFKFGCCWSESPNQSLLLTGGDWPAIQEVVSIDTLRECAVLPSSYAYC